MAACREKVAHKCSSVFRTSFSLKFTLPARPPSRRRSRPRALAIGCSIAGGLQFQTPLRKDAAAINFTSSLRAKSREVAFVQAHGTGAQSESSAWGPGARSRW